MPNATLPRLLASVLLLSTCALTVCFAAEERAICGAGSANWTAYGAPSLGDPAYVETYTVPKAGGSITFDVTYLDVTYNTGVGFDDPIEGAVRRATFDSVLTYVALFLVHNGSAQIVMDTSETDGTGALGVGVPLVDTTTVDCQHPYVFLHLTTGVDPDLNPQVPDGGIRLDFGYNWNSDLGPPGAGEFDLFTVLLHEVTHTIGFASSMAADTTGQGNGPRGTNPDVRILGFDDYLETAGEMALISCPDGTFLGGPSDLVGPSSVHHAGPASVAEWVDLGNTGKPKMYTPGLWSPGTSLVHWDPAGAPPSAVMRPFLSPGTMQRVYTALDVAALRDVGYVTSVGVAMPAEGATNPRATAFHISPRPARDEIRFSFELPESGPVRIELFDATGRLVSIPWSGSRWEGRQELTWDGMRRLGLVSGVYWARLVTRQGHQTQRIIWIQ